MRGGLLGRPNLLPPGSTLAASSLLVRNWDIVLCHLMQCLHDVRPY